MEAPVFQANAQRIVFVYLPGIGNQNKATNKEIEKLNAQTLLDNSMREQLARDDIRRERQQNIVSGVGKLQGLFSDNENKTFNTQQRDIDMKGKDPRVLKRLGLKRNGGKISKMYC